MISTSGNNAGVAASERGSRQVSWRRAPKSLTTSLIDIDVAMTDIVFQRYRDGLEVHGPKAVVDYAIEGLMPATAAAEGSAESEPFVVYLSGYEEADRMDRGEDFDQRSVCYIATDRPPGQGVAHDHLHRTLHLSPPCRTLRIEADQFREDLDPVESAAQFFWRRRSADPQPSDVAHGGRSRSEAQLRSSHVGQDGVERRAAGSSGNPRPFAGVGRSDGPKPGARVRSLTRAAGPG